MPQRQEGDASGGGCSVSIESARALSTAMAKKWPHGGCVRVHTQLRLSVPLRGIGAIGGCLLFFGPPGAMRASEPDDQNTEDGRQ